MSNIRPLERFLPFIAIAISFIGCAIFFRFYLNETSRQFSSDFFSQNQAAISNGDSLELARQLNSLSGSINWICITAKKNKEVFFERHRGESCSNGYWTANALVGDRTHSAISVDFTLALPDPLKYAEVGFLLLQTILLMSVLASAKRAAIRENDLKTSAEREVFRLGEQVAHDIRGPLSALKAVAATFDRDDSRAQLLAQVVSRISNIADDVLRARRVEKHSKSELRHFKMLEVLALLQQIVEEQKLILANQIEINSDKSDGFDFKVCTDPSAFLRVMAIFLRNAADALPQGKILVSVYCSDASLIITVQDNGVGIRPDILPLLFVEGATFGKAEGNGLGLAYAKRQVESWGGDIRIQTAMNVGTTIYLTLRA